MTTVVSADGTKIACSETGSGPPLVVVDPAGAYRGFGPLTSLIPELARDFTAVTYARRGGGRPHLPPRAARAAPRRGGRRRRPAHGRAGRARGRRPAGRGGHALP